MWHQEARKGESDVACRHDGRGAHKAYLNFDLPLSDVLKSRHRDDKGCLITGMERGDSCSLTTTAALPGYLLSRAAALLLMELFHFSTTYKDMSLRPNDMKSHKETEGVSGSSITPFALDVL